MEIEYKGYIGIGGHRNVYIRDRNRKTLLQALYVTKPTEKDVKKLIDEYIMRKRISDASQLNRGGRDGRNNKYN